MCRILPLALVAAATASAQSTYTTLDGTVNLAAGLSTLTDASAVNPSVSQTQLGYLTDDSWSTGVLNIGTSSGGFPAPANGGALAGSFGGGTYHASSNSIIIIGVYAMTVAWDAFDVSLLLANGSYTQAIRYQNADVTPNPTVLSDTGAIFYDSAGNSTLALGAVATAYLLLSISDFDTGNLGVTGIKLSGIDPNLGPEPWPDLTYIGVIGPSAPVPEPSTYGLILGGLALAVAAVRRRRSK